MQHVSRVAVMHSKKYDIENLKRINLQEGNKLDFQFFTQKLDLELAKTIKGFDTVCAFVNDTLNKEVLEELKNNGVSLIALRCAGFNNLDR